MSRRTVLFSEMTPDASWEQDFNDWYDTEHIPARMKAPGFTSAQRYRNVDGPAYLAIYEMESRDALSTPQYKEIKGNPGERSRRMLGGVSDFTRYIGEEIGYWHQDGARASSPFDAQFVYAVFFTVPEARSDEFNRWYEQDHIPALLECEDWLAVRRFDIVDGDPQRFTHLALHYLAKREALESDAREKARGTPWRARLAAEEWFKGHYCVFEKIGQRFLAQG
ncbi:hypothetical protein GXB81_20825 [Paraburkholderia sp. Ac-20336]|uniref:DUF4286 family protein n=1 Tax=Burkholderiaceae TaxID=119060 RepID=UPI00141E50FA|nr:MULTISPECIES: DUF4286 family protein [Burkholderiaceae]MBN3805476.1 hypothetical protein [Paraburkholderia sp. Ac-20336]MBN3849504.1 hypothetical protein [Paraburkholderia sp. Ac-20342]NIF52807.1 hypothetical protein [Burkholderia sp. Ax-1724]NIF78746.1 hypothetical protein [Paraburkholderia sp. Cy-641]